MTAPGAPGAVPLPGPPSPGPPPPGASPSGEGTPGTGVPPRLVLGDVGAGQALPELVHEVTATTVVLGALATRDTRPMHHDRDFAVTRNGTRDIFLNTPNQAAWFERYLTDWSGPHGRLGRVTFRMLGSVFPGDTMRLTGTVEAAAVDTVGCGWASVAIELSVDGDVKTTCAARLALPTHPDDNPWRRRGAQWRPIPEET